MEKKRLVPKFALLMLSIFLFASCKKDTTGDENAKFKNKNHEWVTGNWKQKDLVIAVM